MPMSDDSAPRAAWVLVGVLVLMIPRAVVARAMAEQEPFRAGVVLLTIDVQVTASKDASADSSFATEWLVWRMPVR